MVAASVSERVRQALAGRAPQVVKVRDAERAAAVLVPVVVHADLASSEVLFLVRPTTMPTHAGQVAFPGGGANPGETAVQAALREAHEELGLEARHVEVAGALDDLRTHTGFVVTPVVGLVDRSALAELVPSAREVEAVFRVPIARLVDPRGYRVMRGRRFGGASEVRLRFWVDEPHVIWGATAFMLTGLLDRLGDGAA